MTSARDEQQRALAGLKRRRAAYRATFFGDGVKPHPEAQRVLADLKRFCGINKGGLVVSPVSRLVDPYATIYRSALRDVYLRISAHCGLDETDINEEDHDGRDTATADT